jgi:hypothetical protein
VLIAEINVQAAPGNTEQIYQYYTNINEAERSKHDMIATPNPIHPADDRGEEDSLAHAPSVEWYDHLCEIRTRIRRAALHTHICHAPSLLSNGDKNPDGGYAELTDSTTYYSFPNCDQSTIKKLRCTIGLAITYSCHAPNSHSPSHSNNTSQNTPHTPHSSLPTSDSWHDQQQHTPNTPATLDPSHSYSQSRYPA